MIPAVKFTRVGLAKFPAVVLENVVFHDQFGSPSGLTSNSREFRRLAISIIPMSDRASWHSSKVRDWYFDFRSLA